MTAQETLQYMQSRQGLCAARDYLSAALHLDARIAVKQARADALRARRLEYGVAQRHRPGVHRQPLQQRVHRHRELAALIHYHLGQHRLPVLGKRSYLLAVLPALLVLPQELHGWCVRYLLHGNTSLAHDVLLSRIG